MSREQMKARLEAATSLGEWETTRANDVVIYDPNGYGAYRLVAHADCREDAELIANAPTDLAKLHAALDAVERVCGDWEKLADGDKYYAARIREAIKRALGEDA